MSKKKKNKLNQIEEKKIDNNENISSTLEEDIKERIKALNAKKEMLERQEKEEQITKINKIKEELNDKYEAKEEIKKEDTIKVPKIHEARTNFDDIKIETKKKKINYFLIFGIIVFLGSLINIGYNQTMKYFREFLPDKKRKLLEIYSKLSIYLKKAQKGLKSNNVEEVQWWFGDIFTLLCENKEIVDPIIYKKIAELKNALVKGTTTILFFHNCFKGAKRLDAQMKDVIVSIDMRISDIKLYLQKVELDTRK